MGKSMEGNEASKHVLGRAFRLGALPAVLVAALAWPRGQHGDSQLHRNVALRACAAGAPLIGAPDALESSVELREQ